MLTLNLWAEAQEGGLQDKMSGQGPNILSGTQHSPNECELPEDRDVSPLRSLVAATRPRSYQKVILVPQCFSGNQRGPKFCGS